MEQFDADGRALVAAGDQRPPHEFRALLDEKLDADLTPWATRQGKHIPTEQLEYERALGVG